MMVDGRYFYIANLRIFSISVCDFRNQQMWYPTRIQSNKYVAILRTKNIGPNRLVV